MPKQPKAIRSLVEWSGFLLLAGSIVIVAANAPGPSAQTASPTKAAQSSQSSAVTEAVKASFGSAVEAVKTFKPFYLIGDFNGDSAPDIAIVVRITGRRGALPADVKVLNPFGAARPTFPADAAANPALAFAIVHGTKAGWQTAAAGGKFLLLGESPILILEYRRASGTPDDAKNLMEIKSKRSKRRGETWPPAAAKGDSILLPTEAADSILYWNGTTYRWEESADGD